MNLKSLFVKDVEKEEPPVPKQPVTVKAQLSTQTAYTTGIDYRKYLQEKLDEADLPGPDYLEFSKTLKKLEERGVLMSDEDKFNTAYTAFEVQGLTWDKISSSAGKYLSVLDDIKGRFEKDLGIAQQTLVANKKATVANEKENILKLEDQIKSKKAQIEKLEAEIDSDTLRLSNETGGFNLEYERSKSLINEHISKIKILSDANVTKQK